MQSVSEWVQERLKAVRQRPTKAWKTINRESTPKAIVIQSKRTMMSSCLLTRNLAHILRIFASGPFSKSDNQGWRYRRFFG